jgi:hypothetical protein
LGIDILRVIEDRQFEMDLGIEIVRGIGDLYFESILETSF